MKAAWKIWFAQMSSGKPFMVERKTRKEFKHFHIALSTLFAGKVARGSLDIGFKNLVVGGLLSARRMEPLCSWPLLQPRLSLSLLPFDLSNKFKNHLKYVFIHLSIFLPKRIFSVYFHYYCDKIS